MSTTIEQHDSTPLNASNGKGSDSDDDDSVWSSNTNEIPPHAPDFTMQIFLITSEIETDKANQDLYDIVSYIFSDVLGVLPSWMHVSLTSTLGLVDSKSSHRESLKTNPPSSPGLRGAIAIEVNELKQSMFEVTVSMYMDDFDAYSDPVHLFNILSDLLNEAIDEGYMAKVVKLYARNTAWESMKVYDVVTNMVGGKEEGLGEEIRQKE